MAVKIPQPPVRLGSRGRALWRQIHTGYLLDPVETELLCELCRVLDRCDQISAELDRASSLSVAGSAGQQRAHPLLGALESQQKLADRLASSLGVPVSTAGGRNGHARKAARTRWNRAGKAASVTPIGEVSGAGA